MAADPTAPCHQVVVEVDDEPWALSFVLDLDDDDRHHLSEVHLARKPGGPPLTVEMIRHVGLGAAVEEATRAATTEVHLEGNAMSLIIEKGHRWTPTPEEMANVRRRPGRKVPAGEVETAAEVYLNATVDGLEAVAAALHVSRATAARRIQLARRRGLLPKKGR